MEIRDMILDDEFELDLYLRGRLVDDEGCEREFAVRIVEQDIVEFEDEGLGRSGDSACRGFIERTLFEEDRLGIFQALAEAKRAIERGIEENPVISE